MRLTIAVVAHSTVRRPRWTPQVTSDTPLQFYLLSKVHHSLITSRGSRRPTTTRCFYNVKCKKYKLARRTIREKENPPYLPTKAHTTYLYKQEQDTRCLVLRTGIGGLNMYTSLYILFFSFLPSFFSLHVVYYTHDGSRMQFRKQSVTLDMCTQFCP